MTDMDWEAVSEARALERQRYAALEMTYPPLGACPARRSLNPCQRLLELFLGIVRRLSPPERPRRLSDAAYCEMLARADLIEVADAIVDEALALSATARALKDALRRSEHQVELVEVVAEPQRGPAAATPTVRLTAKPSEFALELVAALRAGNDQLKVVEWAFGHVGTPWWSARQPSSPAPGCDPGAGPAGHADRASIPDAQREGSAEPCPESPKPGSRS